MAKKSGRPFDPFLGARKRAEEARRLLVDKRVALETRMAEARARMEEQRVFRERRMAEMAARLAERKGGRPIPRKRPPREEGGELVPAVPRPKPKPLEGGAAAPLDADRRKPASGAPRGGGQRGRLLSDTESRQSL